MKTFASASRQAMVLDRFLMLACTIAIAAFLANQIWDIDIWWHLAIGRDILARHAVPVTDHFAAAAFGRPYHDSQWLFQIVMALADRVAGMIGVQILMILGWSAAFWFSRRAILHHASPLIGYALLLIAAMASIERFAPRPEIVTMLMIASFWWLLQQRKYENTKGLLLFGLLQVIWTNSHGLFVIGPFMAGCYWLAAALQRKEPPPSVPDGTTGETTSHPAGGIPAASGSGAARTGEMGEGSKTLLKLLGILLAATLVMPYGWEGWRFAIQLLAEVGPWAPKALSKIGELSPTFSAATRSGVAFWFFTTLLAATTLTTITTALRRQVSLPRLLIVAGLLAAAMAGRRNMPLFVIVAAPFIAENLRLLFPHGIIKDLRIRIVITAMLVLTMLGWSWYPLSGTYYMNMTIPTRSGLGATPSLYPYGLPQFLDRIGFKGQIYNSNLLGGFYLYHNYPERLPLTDSRFEIYDLKTLDAIYNAPYSPKIWTWMISSYDIRGLLLQHTSPEAEVLLPMLRSQNTWRLVYFDHAVSFWMRSDTPNLPPAIDLATASLPPEPARPEDCYTLNPFLYIMGADELELQNLQRARKFGWEMESLLMLTGRAQLRLARFDQAEETFKLLLRDYPSNSDAMIALGLLAENRGDLATAESLLRRALEIVPDSPDIRNNYLLIKAALNQSATSPGKNTR